MSRIRWSDLTEKEQLKYGRTRGCGPGKAFFLIPQFIFRASCWQHDFYFARGGDMFDYIEANLMFYAHMVKDIAESKDRLHKRLFHLFAATLYYILVSVYGVFFFNWGRYRTKEDILGK